MVWISHEKAAEWLREYRAEFGPDYGASTFVDFVVVQLHRGAELTGGNFWLADWYQKRADYHRRNVNRTLASMRKAPKVKP